MSTELLEIQRALGKIEGKIDTFILQMKVQDDRHFGLEKRVRSVENQQYLYAGAAAVLATILSFFIHKIFGA